MARCVPDATRKASRQILSRQEWVISGNRATTDVENDPHFRITNLHQRRFAGFRRSASACVRSHNGCDETKSAVVFLAELFGLVQISVDECNDYANNLPHGFVLNPNGSLITINARRAGTGAGQGTVAEGNNAEGAIVGQYYDANNVMHGFLRATDGMITTFDAPGAGTGAGQDQQSGGGDIGVLS